MASPVADLNFLDGVLPSLCGDAQFDGFSLQWPLYLVTLFRNGRRGLQIRHQMPSVQEGSLGHDGDRLGQLDSLVAQPRCAISSFTEAPLALPFQRGDNIRLWHLNLLPLTSRR